MPVKDRPLGDKKSELESPGLNDDQKMRFVSIPIGSDPDTDEDDGDEDDPAAARDLVVERWLNGPARTRP